MTKADASDICFVLGKTDCGDSRVHHFTIVVYQMGELRARMRTEVVYVQIVYTIVLRGATGEKSKPGNPASQMVVHRMFPEEKKRIKRGFHSSHWIPSPARSMANLRSVPTFITWIPTGVRTGPRYFERGLGKIAHSGYTEEVNCIHQLQRSRPSYANTRDPS